MTKRKETRDEREQRVLAQAKAMFGGGAVWIAVGLGANRALTQENFLFKSLTKKPAKK